MAGPPWDLGFTIYDLPFGFTRWRDHNGGEMSVFVFPNHKSQIINHKSMGKGLICRLDNPHVARKKKGHKGETYGLFACNRCIVFNPACLKSYPSGGPKGGGRT
jgi:hypothetical protein